MYYVLSLLKRRPFSSSASLYSSSLLFNPSPDSTTDTILSANIMHQRMLSCISRDSSSQIREKMNGLMAYPWYNPTFTGKNYAFPTVIHTELKKLVEKMKGKGVDTNFGKPSILGKPPLKPIKNQPVVRQPTAFKSERSSFTKNRFASQVVEKMLLQNQSLHTLGLNVDSSNDGTDEPSLSHTSTYANIVHSDRVKNKFASAQGLEDVLENGPYMIRNVPIVLKKWSPNVSLSKEDFTKGWGCFARALIELDATCGLKDKLVVAIPMSEECEMEDKQRGKPFTKKKTSKCGNWESQGKRQGSRFNKSTNGSYRPVVKSTSSTPISNPFSALEEDNGNFIDDLVDEKETM
ncbi:phosphonates import ATP-binding protein like protein [Tanacetum coccineum]